MKSVISLREFRDKLLLDADDFVERWETFEEARCVGYEQEDVEDYTYNHWLEDFMEYSCTK